MDNSTLADAIAADLTDNSTMSDTTSTVVHAVSFYGYTPNLILPIVVAILFLIASLGHTYFMVKRKSWYMWPFVVGVWGETAGYILRRISIVHLASRADGLLWFLTQSLCIILAPALMAASHYMIFGRLISYVEESYSPVKAKRVTLIFVVFDVLSFLVQGGGGSLYASDNPNLFNLAKTILVIGFLIQIISFGIFGVFAFIYQLRAKKAGEPSGDWQKCLYTLYAGCVLILIRSIFRTIEFGTAVSQHGVLLDHEAFYYVLEALPILLCVYLFLVSHPSKYFPTDRSARLHPSNPFSNNNEVGKGGNGMAMISPQVPYNPNPSREDENEPSRYITEGQRTHYNGSSSEGSYKSGRQAWAEV